VRPLWRKSPTRGAISSASESVTATVPVLTQAVAARCLKNSRKECSVLSIFRMNYMGYLLSRLRVNKNETYPCQECYARLSTVLAAFTQGQSVRRIEWEPFVRMFVLRDHLMCQRGDSNPWVHSLTWGEVTALDWQPHPGGVRRTPDIN
jgi:hypothetical protein